MTQTRELCNKLDARLRVIRGLTDILAENDVFKTGALGNTTAQLDAENERDMHAAISLLSEQTQKELTELIALVEVPA
ncbi:MAG: hypothetical protein ACTIOG_07405 [Pseudomonas helleri]|uniref:hypothetical protein n=1 Tax=Pseudomonas helleri TaxID=1608996 RepID=UPI003FD56F76